MLADISAQVDWYPMRFAIAEGWAKFNAKKPAPAKQRPVYARPANPLFTAWSHAA
jgi:hypothetical protein